MSIVSQPSPYPCSVSASRGRPPAPRADTAGRLILIRDMGKMIFAHIRDQSGSMQICLRKDQPAKPPKALDETPWKLAKLLDETLNHSDHQWYLGKMDPAEKALRDQQRKDFQERYSK